MQLDDATAAIIGTAITAGFAALWFQIRTQIKDLKTQLKDAIARIRELESERGQTLADVARSNRELIRTLRARTCLADRKVSSPDPNNIPSPSEAETDRIARSA